MRRRSSRSGKMTTVRVSWWPRGNADGCSGSISSARTTYRVAAAWRVQEMEIDQGRWSGAAERRWLGATKVSAAGDMEQRLGRNQRKLIGGVQVLTAPASAMLSSSRACCPKQVLNGPPRGQLPTAPAQACPLRPCLVPVK